MAELNLSNKGSDTVVLNFTTKSSVSVKEDQERIDQSKSLLMESTGTDEAGQGYDYGSFEMNGTFGLWQMLLTIMKYEKTVLDNNAELQKTWAQTLGGKDGLYSQLYNVGVEVGAHEAQALKDGAYAQFAQAGASGLALCGTLASHLSNISPANTALKEGSLDNNAMRNTLRESSASVSIKEVQPGNKLDEAALDKMEGWANHSAEVDNFRALEKGGVNEEIAATNKRAAELAANDPVKYGKIMKRVDKRDEGLQGQLSKAETKHNNNVQLLNIANSGLSNGAQGWGALYQADEKVEQAKASAANTVLSQVQSQVTSQENKREQNAADALQQMNSWAQAFAQAAASQVHG